MSLAREIELRRDFESLDEELLLSLIHTHQWLERASAVFLGAFGLTATRFNALMIVRDGEAEGITQTDLSRRLLVNRASAGAVVDHLERDGLLERRPAPEDRRAHHLRLTPRGRRRLAEVLEPYYERVADLFESVSAREKRRWISLLGGVRERLRREAGAAPGGEED